MAQPVITALLTVAVGTLVFVLGQFVLVLFIERIRLQARTIEEIAEAIVLYARDYTNPIETWERWEQLSPERREVLKGMSDHLRRLAARLRASALTLRYYSFFEKLRLVLPREAAIEASRSLIGLSNSTPPVGRLGLDAAIQYSREIERLLDIEIPKA